MPFLDGIIKQLPKWAQWIFPLVLRILTVYILPAVAKALPGESALIQDLINFLNGSGPSPALRAGYKHFHRTKAKEVAQ